MGVPHFGDLEAFWVDGLKIFSKILIFNYLYKYRV